MKLHNISLGNLKRRKGKVFLLCIGLTIGVAVVVAMTGITSKMKLDVERKIDEYGANIIVAPKSEEMSLIYGGVQVADTSYGVEELKDSDVPKIWTIKNNKNISSVAPKIIGSYKISDISYLIVGVDFDSEFLIKKWWKWEGEKPDSEYDIVVGSRASSTLKLSPGSKISIADKNFVVSSILYENASQDDISIFMNMKTAQELLKRNGRISMIEVSALCIGCPIEDMVAQISEKLPHARVTPVRQAMTLRMQTVDQLMRFSVAVSVVVIIIGSLIVLISMTSSVNERTKEIGIFRAIGFRRSHIIMIIMTEAFIISLLSGIAGWTTGSLSVSLLAPQMLGIEGIFYEPGMLALSVGMTLLIGLLSSIYPALKAAKLEPLEALRYI
jgi:putative ABC transport system permease protein